MNQDEFARRVTKRLDDDLGTLPEIVLDRLRTARRQAVERARLEPVPSPHFGTWITRLRTTSPLARAAVAAVFAAAIAAGLLYWQVNSHHESIDVETALLADELPIHAYTDPGFDTWLRHSSHEQQ